MRSLGQLHRHARQTSDVVGRSWSERKLIEAPPGTAAIGSIPARVVGLGTGNTTFKCKLLDELGQVAGDEFTVYARTYPASGADLELCAPNVAIDTDIRIMWQVNWLGGVKTEGWFATDGYQLTDCEVAGP